MASTVWVELSASSLLRLGNQLFTAALLLVPVWILLYRPDVSLIAIAAIMAFIAIIGAACRWGEQVCGHRAAFGLLAHMRVMLYDAIIRKGSPATPNGSGSIMSVATRDINSIEVFFAHTIGPAITAVILSVAGVATLTMLDPVAGLIGLIGIIIAWLIPLIGKNSTNNEATQRGNIAQHLTEDASGRLEINSHSAIEVRLKALGDKEQGLHHEVTQQGLIVGLRQGLALLWPWISAALMVVLVPDSGVLAAAIIVALSPSLDAVEGFARTMPTALNSARRYFSIIDAPIVIAEPTNPQPLPQGPLGICIENVNVGKTGSVSLKIAAGEHIGITGPSGSGKSTLAKMIVKLAKPDSGTITIAGVDIADVSSTELREAITMVEQRSVLFRGSVLDNLRVGNPELSEEEATKVLRRASISELPLDKDALKLSGGQQQRLCLARALARNPRVLIVDEATSHQDALHQSELATMLSSLTDTTVIIIAHRKAALSHVDRVIELQNVQNP
ncbi:amino acid ABC transporter ATP-binding/permease protein [Corynebacterium suranareeae]|uniref:amino acid ABC transporter ATP-binding/permease protein n=1 Tax=Corynebacterium suranareeae TaxID=2506452 RepID=UPI001E42CC4D|nr:ABC transporter ATP-binding protein [Corynebacterium suranareeae]